MADVIQFAQSVGPQSFKSPSKSDMERRQKLYHSVVLPNLLKQERNHAFSKRPAIRCAAEADIKIQAVLDSVEKVKQQLSTFESQYQNIESKVDKLELERDHEKNHHIIHQLTFTAGIPQPPTPRDPVFENNNGFFNLRRRRTPPRQAKLRSMGIINNNVCSTMMSPASPSYASPLLLECSRKSKLLDICLTRLHAKVKSEGNSLQQMFEENFKVLKFKRAEKCVLMMIKLQRRLKRFEDNVFQLKDRLEQGSSLGNWLF